MITWRLASTLCTLTLAIGLVAGTALGMVITASQSTTTIPLRTFNAFSTHEIALTSWGLNCENGVTADGIFCSAE